MASRLLVVALALLVLPLAGCIGKSPKNEVKAAASNVTNVTPTKLPDGRDFKAIKETNATVSNATLDGKVHKHDYWKGKETVTIFDYDVDVSPVPVFERGDNNHVFEAFINLDKVPNADQSALVFEGTGKVTFTITKGPAWATSYQMTFRSAASDWSKWTALDVGKVNEYAPQKIETDMPHSFRSLWNWKVQATGPAPVTGDGGLGVAQMAGQPLHVQIIVYKVAGVVDWPPHPDFYSGVKERVVMANKKGTTNVQNAADVEVYGVEPDQVSPDKLVSMGTSTLDVFVNISQLTLPPGVPNGGFTLYWRNANTTPNALGIFSLANETDKQKTAYFHLNLDPNGVDSPYQPTSRFGFKLLANPADDSVVACYRCVPYTIEYTMTIIARPDPAAVAAAQMLPP